MKILHINTSQEGGAAWCARRINNALVKNGIESRMLFARGESVPDRIIGAIARKDLIVRLRSKRGVGRLRRLLMRFPWYINLEKRNAQLQKINSQLEEPLYLHLPWSEYKNIAHHPLVQWADVIHLHWVPDFVDYPTFFKEVKKPIVWTLHDKLPLVGIQHYCSPFSPVPDSLKDIDQFCRVVKRQGVLRSQNLHIVAISESMEKLCKESDVLSGFPCTLIHNGVDIEKFRPYDKQEARLFLKETQGISFLSEDTIVFMFSSFVVWDKNKGLQRVIDSLERIDCNNKVLIVVGGIDTNRKLTASFPIITTGLIKDETVLAKIYSASDFFLQTSYEETFAQTPLEAMACGTPVISTPCSGASDLIRPFNGIICEGYDTEAIMGGIKEALRKHYNSEQIRRYIIEEYDYNVIAKQYIALYNEIQ